MGDIMKEYLKDLAMHLGGNWDQINKYIKQKKTVPKYKSNFPYICIGDDAYPKELYYLNKPPFVLFYQGDINLLNTKKISVVGSRVPNAYGLKSTSFLVNKFKEEFTIVSGLAKGIDACAHKNALDFKTIAVLGCGIDYIYPLENKGLYDRMKQSQLIISEYPEKTKPKKYYFPFRNRIIAALGKDLYVMSAKKRSGTMTTVNEALNLNKHVICLPYQIDDPSGEGCNQLILEGANILTKD